MTMEEKYGVNIEVLRKYTQRANFDQPDNSETGYKLHSFDLGVRYLIAGKENPKNKVKARSDVNHALMMLQKELKKYNLDYNLHMGNLLYIAEPAANFGLMEEFGSPLTAEVYAEIYNQLMAIYKLKKVNEEKELLPNFSIILTNTHSQNMHRLSSDLTEAFGKEYLIERLITAGKKILFDNYYGFLDDVASICREDKGVSATTFFDTAQKYKVNRHEADKAIHRFREFKITFLQNYIKEELGVQMKTRISSLIYWILRVYFLVPQTNKPADYIKPILQRLEFVPKQGL